MTQKSGAVMNPVISEDIILTPRPGAEASRLHRMRGWITTLLTLNIIHWPLLIGGTAVSLYVVVQNPTVIRVSVLAIYAALWASKLLNLFSKRNYGVVTTSNGATLAGAIIQLVNVESGEASHVLSTITDRHGRFILFAHPGAYEMLVAKEGFVSFRRSVGAEETAIEIRLEPLQTTS
jgi:hypothetical protein